MKVSIEHVTELPPAGQIDAIREGFSAEEADRVRDSLGLSQKMLFQILGTPERTGVRLLKENRRLDPAASERLFRLVEVLRHAEEAFGSKERAIAWMTTTNPLLRSAPIELLDTEIGHNQVRRVLLAIEHGMAV